jgi:hypothetical protein
VVETTKSLYEKLRKKRLKEREERFKKTMKRIKEQEETLRRRKWIEAARRKRIKEKLLLKMKQEQKAKEALTAAKAAVVKVEENTKASLYVPEIMRKINKMLSNADKTFKLADYEETTKLAFKIKRLLDGARSELQRRTEEKKKGKEEGKYFYCLIPFSEEKRFGKIGINNDEVYTVPYRDVAAVVSDSPLKDYEMTEDNTRRHEAVLRQVMEEHAVVPVEFGTVIKNEKILKRLLTKAYGHAKECLKLVDNMVELGVKAVLEEDIVFVDPKKRKEYISNILESLNTRAKQAVTADLFSDRLLLNASFLVNREKIDAFSTEVTQLQEKYPMLKMLYSGPWAPYNFVYIKIGTRGMEVAQKGETNALYH